MKTRDEDAPGEPQAGLDERIRLLEAALVEYVERYGVTPLARAALTSCHRSPGEDRDE